MQSASVRSTSSRGSDHLQSLYKNRGERQGGIGRRKQVEVEIRKKKKHDSILERRARAIDPSTLSVETELGGEILLQLMTTEADQQRNAVQSIVEKMRCSLVPLGPMLAQCGLVARALQIRSTCPNDVFLLLRNLGKPGTHFEEQCDYDGALRAVARLMRDPSWECSLDQLLFVAASMVEDLPFQGSNILVQEQIDESVGDLCRKTDKSNIVVLRNAAWLFSLIIKHATPCFQTITLLAEMAELVPLNDLDMVRDACAAIEHVAEEDEYGEVIREVCVPQIVQALQCLPTSTVPRNPSPLTLSPPSPVSPTISTLENLLRPLLQALTAIFDADQDSIVKSVHCGLLLVLDAGLACHATAADACWILAVITSHSTAMAARVLATLPLLLHLRRIFEQGTYDQRKDALSVFSALVVLPFPAATNVCVSVIQTLCDLLTVIDANLVVVVLDILKTMLERDERADSRDVARRIEEYGGLHKMEFLQHNPIQEVSLLSCEIIDNFFDESHENDEHVLIENTVTARIDNAIDTVLNSVLLE